VLVCSNTGITDSDTAWVRNVSLSNVGTAIVMNQSNEMNKISEGLIVLQLILNLKKGKTKKKIVSMETERE
jgi:hypothetical protein